MATSTSADGPTPVRIVIVDDHPVVREGLAMHLNAQPDLEVCGEADDVPSALALFARSDPDLAVIDISLPDGNGLDLVRRIAEHHPRVRILVWSMYPAHLYAERALRAGAHGYLNKGEATSQLLTAVRTILQGKIHLCGDLADRLLRRVVGRRTEDLAPIDTLSDRELEAFGLIGEGLTTEEIATRMHISPKTVETFRSRIKEKLGLPNMTQLIQRAAQWVLESR